MSIFSISEGLRKLISSQIIPSTTNKGWVLLPNVLLPRMEILKLSPTRLDDWLISTPATCPCKDSITVVAPLDVSLVLSTLPIAPVKSDFFCTP